MLSFQKTVTINLNGFIGVVTRKQYLASIVFTNLKKKQITINPSIYNNWLLKLEEGIITIYKSWKIKYALNCNGSGE